MKERRHLLLLLCVFAAAIAVLFGIQESRKYSRKERQEDAQTILTKVTGENLSGISYLYDKNQITFLYDNGKWIYENDPHLPLNTDIPNRMAEIVTNLTSVRTLTRYADKADYGINDSSIQVTATGKDGTSYSFTIGSYLNFSEGYYIMADGDKNIYFVPGEIRKPFTYQSAEFTLMTPIPEIRQVNYLCVETPEERFEVFPDANRKDWYSLVNGEKVTLDPINTRAAADMMSRLEWSGCVDYDVKEDEMSGYGLDKPTTITADYTGADNAAHSFTLCVGGATGSRYYARLPGSQMVLLIQGELVSPLLNAGLNTLQAER